MTDIISEGWLWIYSGSDYLKLFVEKVKVDYMINPTTKHFPSNTHMGYDMQKMWLMFKCMGVWGTSHANFSNIIDYLLTWQGSGTFTAKFIRDSSNNGIEFDGDNQTFTVMVSKNGIKGMEKISNGDQQYYRIEMLVLEQCG